MLYLVLIKGMLNMVNMCMMLLAVLNGIKNNTELVPSTSTTSPFDMCSQLNIKTKNEYMIIESSNYPELMTKSNNLMANDWFPQGGLSVHGYGYQNKQTFYTQAFVKTTISL